MPVSGRKTRSLPLLQLGCIPLEGHAIFSHYTTLSMFRIFMHCLSAVASLSACGPAFSWRGGTCLHIPGGGFCLDYSPGLGTAFSLYYMAVHHTAILLFYTYILYNLTCSYICPAVQEALLLTCGDYAGGGCTTCLALLPHAGGLGLPVPECCCLRTTSSCTAWDIHCAAPRATTTACQVPAT